jgi:hypothetical protein
MEGESVHYQKRVDEKIFYRHIFQLWGYGITEAAHGTVKCVDESNLFRHVLMMW